jgi:DNA primase
VRQNVIDLIERHIGKGRFSGESHIMLRCPFHKGGEETKPSLGVNVDLGIFQCFTCKTSGNIIKLLKLLGLPSHVVDAETEGLRKELQDNQERLKWKKRKEILTADPFLATTLLPETMLRHYQFIHTKLTDAGFSREWLEYMDVGFDRVNNRITYPIRDLYGHLAGMSGGATIAGQYPKYKVYEGRRKDPNTGRWLTSDYGEWFDEKYPDYEFHNHHYLWNYDSVYPRVFFGRDENPYIIVVEGFKACLWMLQNGYLNTVALMGSSMSDRQCSLIHRLSATVILFLDQDDAGRKGTRQIGRVLRKQQPGVHIAHYPYADECQPDDLGPAEVTAAIQGAITYPQFEKELRTCH